MYVASTSASERSDVGYDERGDVGRALGIPRSSSVTTTWHRPLFTSLVVNTPFVLVLGIIELSNADSIMSGRFGMETLSLGIYAPKVALYNFHLAGVYPGSQTPRMFM